MPCWAKQAELGAQNSLPVACAVRGDALLGLQADKALVGSLRAAWCRRAVLVANNC